METAVLRYIRFNIILMAFRLLELGFALLLLFWISARVPLALKVSSEYSLRLFSFLARPVFVFAFCNVIIVAVLVKSGRFSSALTEPDDKAIDELYEEIVKMIENRHACPPAAARGEEVVYEDKQIISEVNTVARVQEGCCFGVDPEREDARKDRCTTDLLPRETDTCQKISRFGEESPAPEKLFGDEELSSEEFQRAIEAFIAKQLRFRQLESLAIVLPSH